MNTGNIVKITNRGMVRIPAILREKYNLKDGNYVIFIEDEGTLRIIPLKSTEKLQEESVSVEKMVKIMKESEKRN